MNIGCSIRINEKYFEIEILVSEIEFHSFISHCELFCEPYRNHFSELKSMGDPWQFSSPPPPLQMQFNQSRHKNCSILPGMTDISASVCVCVHRSGCCSVAIFLETTASRLIIHFTHNIIIIIVVIIICLALTVPVEASLCVGVIAGNDCHAHCGPHG